MEFVWKSYSSEDRRRRYYKCWWADTSREMYIFQKWDTEGFFIGEQGIDFMDHGEDHPKYWANNVIAGPFPTLEPAQAAYRVITS